MTESQPASAHDEQRLYEAITLAMYIHRDQYRRYTGEPYWKHLAEVAALTRLGTTATDALITAWLHDAVEDTGLQPGMLCAQFGERVRAGVLWLSCPALRDDEPRSERKARAREQLSQAPGWVQTIKCADLASNLSSIADHDPDFARTYVPECRALYECLDDASPPLRMIASKELVAAERKCFPAQAVSEAYSSIA